MTLYCGSASVSLAPPLGMPMAGYLDREGYASGFLDDLRARCIALANDGSEVLLVLMDIVRVDSDLDRELRIALSRALGVDERNVVLMATHTHSGPEVSLGEWSTKPLNRDEQAIVRKFRSELVRKVVNCAVAAFESMESCRAELHRAEIFGVASNRIDPSKQFDPEMLYIILASSGRIRACLANFACHPTVLGPSNTLYSGDLHGWCSRELEEILGSVVMITNGAAGNVSTRYTRRGHGVEELERMSAIVVDSFVKALDSATAIELEGDELDLEWYSMNVPVKEVDLDELARKVHEYENEYRKLLESNAPHAEVQKAKSKYFGAKIALERFRRIGKSVELRLGVLRIGRFSALLFPGELFVEYQLELKNNAIQRDLYATVVGYANGYVGYVPYPGYGETYESLVSVVDPSYLEELKIKIVEIVLSKR